MQSFDDIFAIAAKRKGGPQALNALLPPPLSADELRAITDENWLSGLSKSVFQAGFNWKVVDKMWPGFQAAFHGFDPGRCAMLTDEDLTALTGDRRIVRHGAKIRSVQENAVFLIELAKQHGSASAAFAEWPSDDFVGLLALLKKRGSRLGGTTAQYALRSMGRDGFILSRDVVARLMVEGVIDKAPTSQKAMRTVQDAFTLWQKQSGRSLQEISRVLAMSIG
uniref:DNA-3-methyladenine glycosylase I n=1 Tax=Pararhizobium sp. IMCC3301 TaxID=3067904 RepID=UPI002740CE33|nr:DNA-3-methyladenine glycosylase I [Pararhizobium sp. IMCC3301]